MFKIFYTKLIDFVAKYTRFILSATAIALFAFLPVYWLIMSYC